MIAKRIIQDLSIGPSTADCIAERLCVAEITVLAELAILMRNRIVRARVLETERENLTIYYL